MVEVSEFDHLSVPAADIAEHYGVTMAVKDLDYPGQPTPTLEAYTALFRESASLMGPVKRWVAREDGRIVGTGSATYPEHENRHATLVRVNVLPTLHRRGIGTAILRAMLPNLGIDGRSVAIGYGIKADASGERWADKLGFVRTHAFVRQILTFAEVDTALWQNPVPDGFRLERWTGAAPEELIEQYARARTAIADAPVGDSTIAFPEWTPDRVRAHEAELSGQDAELRVIVARHEADGRIAGFTELGLWAAQPVRAQQLDTAVMAEFRGRGLGLAVKGAMVRWLTADRPAIMDVFTSTAYDNAHMIRVNHALGFRNDGVIADIEVGLAELAERLRAGAIAVL